MEVGVVGKRLGASQAEDTALACLPRRGSGVTLFGSWGARAGKRLGRTWLGKWGTTEVESLVG